MKRTLSVILALAMILALFVIIPSTSAGAIGSKGWYYVLDSSGKATIIAKQVASGVPNGAIDLNIPSAVDGHTVIAIGDGAFSRDFGIGSVTFPNTVKTIGAQAFRGCRYLKSVKFPASLISIGEMAFFECDKLKEVTVPKSVTTIGEHSLGWYGLYSYDDGDSVLEDEDTVAGFTIKGYRGSEAERYAKNCGFKFTALTAYKFSNPKITKLDNICAGVRLTIPKATGAPKYRVFYNTSKGWVKLGDTTNGYFVHRGAKSGTKYTYTARVISKDGKTNLSDFNRTGWAITFVAAPKAPKLTNTKSGVKVVGAKVKGAAKYRVFRKSGKGSWIKVADVVNPAVVDKTAKNGVTYRYTLRCLNKNGKFISSYNSGSAIKCRR